MIARHIRRFTEKEIVDRAAEREANRRHVRGLLVAAGIWVAVGAILSVLVFSHLFARPRDFLCGVLIGSLMTITTFYLSVWSWDRVQWVRWFSRMG